MKLLIFFIGLITLIYFLYLKPIKSIGNLMTRGFFYNIIGLKNKERELYLRYINNDLFRDRRRDIEYVLGLNYAKAKNYEEAVACFKKAFIGYDKPFNYKKEFNVVIDSFLKCNKTEEALSILKIFLKQKVFDKKFLNMEQKYKHLL